MTRDNMGEPTAEYNPWQAEVLYRSPVWHIGKHDWRMVVYIHPRWGNCTGFEWRKPSAGRWGRDVDWPRYNGDHCDGGIPSTLRKLYKAHKAEIKAALAKAA